MTVKLEMGNINLIWRLSVSITESSYISAEESDISSKFGMQIDLHFRKQMPSPNLDPEVDFGLYGRQLENWI